MRAAVDALVAELDAAGPAPDDDAIMHVRDVLAEHAETVMHRRMVGSKRGAHAYVQPSADLDAAVLALMLRHRDDTVGTSPKRPTTARRACSSVPASPVGSPRAAAARTATPPPMRPGVPPHMNVGALEFRPRASPDEAAAEAAPALPVSAPAPDTPDDEDEDEFSPFARKLPPNAAKVYPDVAAVEPPELAALSLHAEANAPELTPLEVFCSVLLAHNEGLFAGHGDDPAARLMAASQTIQTALERSNYDVHVALQVLRDAHASGVDVATVPTPGAGTSDDSALRVCRFFLAGECRRADCRFSHDLNKALCRFWLRGQCLNDPCSFLHDYDALSMLAQSMVVAPAPAESSPPREDTPLVVRPKLDASQTPWAAAAARAAAEGPSAPSAADASRGSRRRTHVATSGRISLRPPTLLPTLSTGAALAVDMQKLRAAQQSKSRSGADAWQTTRLLLSERHKRIREQLLVAAGGDAGGWGSSAQASDEPGARGLRGQWIGEQLGLCLGVARAANVGRLLSLDERTEAALDLHGLHVAEALEACERFLLALESEGFRGLAFLCVGAGKHSGRSRGKVAAQVREFLDSWDYVRARRARNSRQPHAEYDGVIACDPCTHS